MDYPGSVEYRQKYNLIAHQNMAWGSYPETPKPMDANDGCVCQEMTADGSGRIYKDPEDIKVIADANYNSEQTDPDSNYKNTYNLRDKIENTHFGKQWMFHIYQGRMTVVSFTRVVNMDGAVGYNFDAPTDPYTMLCDQLSQHCSLGNVPFRNVHTGHIYDRLPLGAKQLTPDAVVTVGFEDRAGKTHFATIRSGFTKAALECTKPGAAEGDPEEKQYVMVKKSVPALSYQSNYTSTDGMVLKDCKHTPDKTGGSWDDDCTDATKIKGYLSSQDKAREVTRKLQGEEVKVSEAPQVGHPKKGEYTLQKMNPKDAKKVCAKYYDKSPRVWPFYS